VVHVDQQRQSDQHQAEQHAEADLRALRVADAVGAELGHAVGDRLNPRDRRAPSREGLQDQHHAQSRGDRERRLAAPDQRHGVRVKGPHHDHREHAHDEHRRWQHQQPRRLGDAEHVDRGEQREPCQRHQQKVV